MLTLALAACGSSTSVLDQPAPNSDFVRVLVEANDGFVDPEPAHAEAARQCGQRLQQAVFFMAHPVGTDDRMFLFRCE